MSWGAGSWGASPWGATFGAMASVEFATHSRLNAVDVRFSGLVQTVDRTRSEDALNPANWTLTAVTPSAALVPNIQVVETVQNAPTAGVTKTIVQIFFDADLDADATYLIEASSSIETLNGSNITAPFSVQFLTARRGFVPVTLDIAGEDRTDIAFAGDASEIGGTYRYDETGDLANESGVTYLRKRVIRRATTLLGSIVHLPEYGAGQRLKTNITQATTTRLRSELRAQILEEPDVRAVAVSVFRPVPGILRVTIQITQRAGTLIPEITLLVPTE